MWKQLYQRQIGAEGRQIIHPLGQQVDAELNRVEREIGVRLPAGYRAFIHQFGPGEIGGYFRIFGPKIRGFGNMYPTFRIMNSLFLSNFLALQLPGGLSFVVASAGPDEP